MRHCRRADRGYLQAIGEQLFTHRKCLRRAADDKRLYRSVRFGAAQSGFMCKTPEKSDVGMQLVPAPGFVLDDAQTFERRARDGGRQRSGVYVSPSLLNHPLDQVFTACDECAERTACLAESCDERGYLAL